MLRSILVLSLFVLLVRPYLYLGSWGYDIQEYGTGNPSYKTFNPTPILIPPGYVPTSGLSILVRAWGDFDGTADAFNMNFPAGNVFQVVNNNDADDPFGLVYSCFGFPCTPVTPHVSFPDTSYYDYIPNAYGYDYLPFYTQADLSLATTQAMLAVNPNQIDWTLYFKDVDDLYYMKFYFAFGSIGFGGDPHIETYFGELFDIDDGSWNVVSTENYDINIRVEEMFTRQVVLVSDTEVVTMKIEGEQPMITVNEVPLLIESADNVFGGVIQYSSTIQYAHKTSGSLPRYWIAEVTLNVGVEKVVFHIADHPEGGLFYEMVYVPHLDHKTLRESRSVPTHSGLLFSPPMESRVSRITRDSFGDYSVGNLYQRSFHKEN